MISSLQGPGRKGEWEVAHNRDGQLLAGIKVDYVHLELTLPDVLRVSVSLTDVASEDLQPSEYMMLSMSFIPFH